jgi:CheY-like chemotaxis protein
VLFGDFARLATAGFDDVLRGGPVEVLRADGRDLFERLADGLPDVVVLDLEHPGTPARICRLVHEFPALTVVTCSTRHPLMRVYPPFHHGECYEDDLELDAFVLALQG